MGGKGSAVDDLNWEIYAQTFLGFILIYAIQFSHGYTNPVDVTAINNLYVALESPSIPGWVAVGGDPCGDAWQGVQCDTTDISSITLNVANLGGVLGDDLGSFSSIKSIDLSNNRIAGSIPSSLPLTLQNLFLSDNKFTGSIPSTLSSLTQLAAMSVNDNQLSGEIPDAFQGLTALVNLDISSNNLSGQLPQSLATLSSLTTFHLQNNQLSGTLDVLQDLPVRDLNIENNLFSGPIPDKMLSIPNFKKDGNLFNTSVSPLPSPTSTTPPVPSPTSTTPPSPSSPFFPSSGEPPPGKQNSTKQTPGKQGDRQPTTEESNSRTTNKNSNKKRIVGISLAAALSVVILALILLFLLPRCYRRRRRESSRIPKRHEIAPYTASVENPREDRSFFQRDNQIEEGPKAQVPRPKEERQIPKRMNDEEQYMGIGSRIPKHDDHERPVSRFELDMMAPQAQVPRPKEERQIPKRMNDEEQYMGIGSRIPKHDDHERPVSRFELDMMAPPPPPPPPVLSPPPVSPPRVSPPPPPPPPERVIAKPAKPRIPPTSVKSFTIASLQQHTNSFSQENLIGGGTLGNVYRAELPNGKLLAVKKLDRRTTSQQKDDEFINLVNSIDKIRHANVVQLVGFCAEHGQRLLIYEYCSNGTLQDALHSDDEFRKKLSWNSRVRMALGAARALEYLHEFCDPPVVHRNFKAANILLDDELSVHVSDCGLAPLISSGSVNQLSGQILSAYGYGAPEFDSGIYTFMSDVYSFGVVMLELLTGRKSYDRERSRGEQYLVRWAMPQLHDIDALSRMVDPSLDGKYPVKSLSNFADIVLRCVQKEPEFRPPMSEIVQDLIEMIRRDSSK